MTAKKKSESRKELVWADDVLAVYQSGLECPKSWSRARRELHSWATDPENREKFYTTLVPKAIDIITKHGRDDDEDFVAREERKSIVELTQILNETLARVQC